MAKKSKKEKIEEEAPVEEEPTPEPEPEPEPKQTDKKLIKEKLGIGYKLLVYNDGSYDKVYD